MRPAAHSTAVAVAVATGAAAGSCGSGDASVEAGGLLILVEGSAAAALVFQCTALAAPILSKFVFSFSSIFEFFHQR